MLIEIFYILGVNIEKILLGQLDPNDADIGNMKGTKFYACPNCSNVISSTGEAEISHWGRRLQPTWVVDERSMTMKTNFNPIDLQTWPRGQMFHYFSKMAPTGYSLTVELDVTVMKDALKERKIKFFPAYLWLVVTMLNRQIEFKVAVQDEVLGYWDTLTPLYAVFHEDDKTISLMWTEYDEKFSVFYQNYLENHQQYGNNHGVLSQPDKLPPENSCIISCVPWIEFKHFSVQSFENKPYYFPSIEAGRIFEENGYMMLPLSMTLHHATTDGWHVKRFLDDIQHAMNHPQGWLEGY